MRRIEQSGLRAFFIISFGQIISILGSGLSKFAISVWVCRQTGSVTPFALMMLSISLPGLLVTPLAGIVVDRWDRRLIMLLADFGEALSTLAFALLFVAGSPEVSLLYLVLAVSSIFSVFQGLASTAVITTLVPKRHFGRAAGLIQTAAAVAQIAAPFVAGALLSFVQMHGVILIDFATYLFAMVTLLLVRIPKGGAAERISERKRVWSRSLVYGFDFIRQRRGLAGLMAVFAVFNFSVAFCNVLVAPLLLHLAPVQTVGAVLSAGAVGMLVGGVLMSATGGPKRLIHGVLGVGMLAGCSLVLMGLRPSVPLAAVSLFVVLVCSPIITSCNQAIWMRKVPVEAQGRVIAMRMALSTSSAPIAFAIAGPLTDKVFEPLLATAGPFAGTAGRVIGTGPGRGIGLGIIVTGLLILITVTAGYLHPRVRCVEEELPDAISERSVAEPLARELDDLADLPLDVTPAAN